MARDTVKIELQEPLRSVRLLSRRVAGDGQVATAARWLMRLGEARARREAESKALQSIVQALQRTLQAINGTVGTRIDQIAETVVELGLAVAREVVGEAVDRGAVDPTAIVVHCLRDCVHGAAGADLVVHLHPDDLALVTGRLAGMPELQRQLGDCRIAADPALGRGAVRAETATGRLRHDPREVLERVAAAVRTAAASAVGGQA